jgi:Fe-S cluster assembly iron-binding protein IscA
MMTLTPAALAWLSRFRKDGDHCLLIRLRRSGCSGFAYDPVWVDRCPDDAQILSLVPPPDFLVAVARKDAPHLDRVVVDLVREGLNRVLVWDNPAVTSTCGCGASVGFEKPGV